MEKKQLTNIVIPPETSMLPGPCPQPREEEDGGDGARNRVDRLGQLCVSCTKHERRHVSRCARIDDALISMLDGILPGTRAESTNGTGKTFCGEKRPRRWILDSPVDGPRFCLFSFSLRCAETLSHRWLSKDARICRSTLAKAKSERTANISPCSVAARKARPTCSGGKPTHWSFRPGGPRWPCGCWFLFPSSRSRPMGWMGEVGVGLLRAGRRRKASSDKLSMTRPRIRVRCLS